MRLQETPLGKVLKTRENPDVSEKDRHVVPHGDGWAVRSPKSKRASQVFDTKKDAMERGIEIARNNATALVVHGRDGKIQDRREYGS